MSKMCFVTFPIDFYNENKEVVENFLGNWAELYPWAEYDYAIRYQFEGELSEDANEYLEDFHKEHKDIPMEIWQETGEGGYDFSYGMTSYYLPNKEPIHIPHNHEYDVVSVAKLEKLTSMDELKALIEKKKAENPIPNMDEVFTRYHEDFVEQFKRENCGL